MQDSHSSFSVGPATPRLAFERALIGLHWRLLCRCLHLTKTARMTDADMVVAYDLSTAEDIVQGVLLSLLTRFSKKTLKCDDLAGYACGLARLHWISSCRRRRYRESRREALYDYTLHKNGMVRNAKRPVRHEFNLDDRESVDPRIYMDSGMDGDMNDGDT